MAAFENTRAICLIIDTGDDTRDGLHVSAIRRCLLLTPIRRWQPY